MVTDFINSTTNEWLVTLEKLLLMGSNATPRGMDVKELLAHQTKISMTRPIVNVPQRRLGYRFMAAEAYWILTGDNRVDTIKPYSKDIAKFSDDGHFFHGAYGPMIIDQLHYVVDSLITDGQSRQAVLTIWRPNPRPSKDIPCTVAIQWLIRDGYLHCIDTMRSSDIWLGWPYDVFNFSMLSLYICLLLRERGLTVGLGSLVLQAGSQHLYETNFEAASNIVAIPAEEFSNSLIEYPAISPYLFSSPVEFLDWLKAARDHGAIEAFRLVMEKWVHEAEEKEDANG